MLLGAIAAFVIDKRYYWAAGYCVAGAILSFIGLIHGEQVSGRPAQGLRSATCSVP
jgi:AGZA family xanthine/uracil permease-like MFS transporter